jgi:hypothetical protein
MVGWATKMEEDICLGCHGALRFDWREREDGGKVEGIHPTVAVGLEADDADPALLWVTMQTRCRCGFRAGRVVEMRVTFAEGSGPVKTQ